MYKCEIIADSLSPQGNRLTTFLVTYPRIVHAEMLRHRMFSRNVASSRAIPFEKMVKDVEENPFIPIAWQKDHKGMQGNEYFTGVDVETNNKVWLQARDNAIRDAILMNRNKVTKQLCNRLLEPFVWTTELITETEFENFFELRCPQYVVNNYTPLQNKTKVFYSRKDTINFVKENGIKSGWENCEKWSEVQWQSINNSKAEIHIQKIAEMMWDTYNESKPKELKSWEWHIPFGDKISNGELRDYFYNVENNPDPSFTAYQEAKLKISTARCARLSYMTFDGKVDYEKDINLHDRLLKSRHMSPFEHCAKAMSDEEYHSFRKGKHEVELIDNTEDHYWFIEDDSGEDGWCNNFRGFVQYRYLIENPI